MNTQLTIIIADDHSVVRHGVKLILRRAFPELSVIHAETFDELLSNLGKNPELILLDINLPGGNTTQMMQKIRAVAPQVLILMFSAYEEENYALRYIQAGSNGFLSKHSSDLEIIGAVKTVLETGRFVSEAVKEKILENAVYKIPTNPLEVLSDREIEVANLLARGEGTLEIANALNIQMTTVSTYKNRIYEKLRINNIINLAEMLRLYKN